MYIGGGIIVVILIVLLVLFLLRRAWPRARSKRYPARGTGPRRALGRTPGALRRV